MELLTVKETAAMLRVSTVTIRRYIASGKLPAVRVGRNVRIRQKDAERVIKADASTVTQEAFVRHRDKHIAEARAAYSPTSRSTSDEDDDPQADSDEDPARYLMEHYAPERQGKVPARSKFADKSDEWLLKHHPLWELQGLIKDDGPTDVAENHDKYLADAYADTHENE